MGVELFLPVKTAACFTDVVLVGFSGGKDSAVVLDLCHRYFKRVVPFFMYLVPGLSFQEASIRFYEQKYGVEVVRLPHPMLSTWLRFGVFRQAHYDWPEITFNDIYHYLRISHDIYWIAAGERIADSIVRRAMMKKSGSIDQKRGRFYPVAHFSKADIMAYIKRHRLKLAPEYRVLGYSFRALDPPDLVKIKAAYAADYARIQKLFPFVEAGCVKEELRTRDQKDGAPEI